MKYEPGDHVFTAHSHCYSDGDELHVYAYPLAHTVVATRSDGRVLCSGHRDKTLCLYQPNELHETQAAAQAAANKLITK